MLHPKKSPPFTQRIAFKIACVALIIAGVLVMKHLLFQYLNLNVYNEQHGFIYELSNRFDLDDEVSVPSWFSLILLFTIGVMSFFAAFIETNKTRKVIWLIVGVIGIGLSIDEAAGLHEFMLQSVHNIFYLEQDPQVSRNAWWLIAPLIVLGLLSLLWVVIKSLPKRTSLLFAFGAIVMVGGAVIIDAVAVGVAANSFAYQGLLVALEESLEMVGAIIILYALLDYIEQYYGTAVGKALHALRHP